MADEAHPNQVRQNEPPDLGYAPPDTGQGDAASSEIPEGVDALRDEQIQAAEERGGGAGGEDGGDALDVSAIMQESGGADETDEEAG
ncbi:MAG TPA: hypothetical protein VNT54_09820 [Solirubrobacteraceae bacterium]|nr:hypothetical protein [Solirubrobacteraceae bacterium]